MALFLSWVLNRLMQNVIGDIAHVELVDLGFEGPSNGWRGQRHERGPCRDRQTWLEKGLGVRIRPHGPDAKATLANIGQMQAIAHDVISMIGLYMDVGNRSLSLSSGGERKRSLVLAVIPSEQDAEALIAAVKGVPVLEGAIRKPLSSRAGQELD